MNDIDIATMPGVVVKSGDKFTDQREWLMECFRSDEIDKEFMPEMAYISVTLQSVARGPHEHLRQTGYFCFIGASTFKVICGITEKDQLLTENQ